MAAQGVLRGEGHLVRVGGDAVDDRVGDDTVTIAVTGASNSGPCSAVRADQAVTVELDSPLDDRDLTHYEGNGGE